MVNRFSYWKWVFGISAHKTRRDKLPPLSFVWSLFTILGRGGWGGRLTQIGDPHGHPLVEEVEHQDEDEVDAGGGDGRGQLWRDEPAHQLDLPQGVLDNACEGSVHSQPVRYDADDAGHDHAQLLAHTHTNTNI